MFEYIDYLSNKKDLISKISQVKDEFLQLEEFNIDVSEAVDKLNSARKSIEEDALSIVLVGAFSDGKTSVVAGWLNEKVDSMKIDSDESSDEILKYSPNSLPEGCQIVDTPGLFGDKVGSDEDGAQITLSEITRKYISEANVILYVVPSKNPIKDSHKACVRWILNDLNKLSSTIFVINKMDDIADLTDEEEFKSKSKTITDSLRSKLIGCGVKQQDAEKTKVVCVSASPGGDEIEKWKNNRDEYLRRSHMTSLEEVTNDILKNSREALIAKAGCDVLNDELNKALAEINRQEHAIDEVILPEKKESLKRNKKDLEALIKRIVSSRGDIKDELKKLNKGKITKIRSASMDTFKDVLEDEIGLLPGKEGAVISDEISDIYNRYAHMYSGWTIDVGDKFQSEYDKQNATIDALLKKGVAGASAGLKEAGKIGVEAFKKAIFAGRDLLAKLGIVVKFKPWQVVNLAEFAVKALPFIGAAIDVVSNIVENISVAERERRFEKNKDEIKNEINGVFSECYDQLNNDNWFFENFAPGIKMLEEQVTSDEKEIQEMEEMKNKYMTWSAKAKELGCNII